MRPLELVVDGFRSYRDTATFNFEGRNLFGIVGPTGAGKSSILDAMVYALFGKTPKLERETKRLINTSSEEAKVKLLFEVDDTTWEVTRVIRAKGNSPVVLRNYQQDRLEVSGARAVDDRIEQLLGLDFRAFCSSVTLPQGEFDRFLSASPTDRARVLKGVFRLERVDALRDLVRERRAANDSKLATVEATLAALPDDPEARITSLQSELAKLNRSAQEIREAVPEESKLHLELQTAGRELSDAVEESKSVAATLRRIPEAEELEDLAEKEASQYRIHKQASVESDGAKKALEVALADALEARDALGGPALDQLRDLIKDLDRLGLQEQRADQELSRARTEAVASEKKVREAGEVAATAESDFKAADLKVRSAHEQHAAHVLRRALVAGKPCPVCGQGVSKVPAHGREPELESAEKIRIRAEKALVKARQALEASSLELSRFEERLRRAESELALVGQERSSAFQRAEEMLGKGVVPEAEFERRSKILEAKNDAVEGRRAAVGEAEASERQAAAALERVRKLRLSFTEILIGVSVELGVEPPTFEGDARALVSAAKKAADEGRVKLERSEKSRESAQTRINSMTRSLQALREQFGFKEGETAADALAAASRNISLIENQISGLEESIERRVGLSSELVTLLSSKQHLDLLFNDLGDSKFPAFLLEGHRRLLSELGSEKLLALTGRYRFDEDGSFNIIDVVNDVRRSPDTLSGGEAFLASLALALAMAEAVSSRGGRLDCFFLDEGFGSLDSASLDLALEGIEALAVPGRLIGLISHVGGIQTRLDDLIVLDRTQDGTTRVEQTDGPIGYAPTI